MRVNISTPRLLDAAIALLLLLIAAPLMLLIGAALAIQARGPICFAQERLGRNGVPFRLHKFRTLAVGPGATVAPANDGRTTRLGRGLRWSHLDELPQLFDVLRGRMALVGPRPEVPDNLAAVEAADLERVLAVRPGITGPTQLALLAEDELLAGESDPVATYRQILVPAKVRMDVQWLAARTLGGDLLVLLWTPLALVSRRVRARSRQRVQSLLAAARGGGSG